MLLALTSEVLKARVCCEDPNSDPAALHALADRIETYLEAVDPKNQYPVLDPAYEDGMLEGIFFALGKRSYVYLEGTWLPCAVLSELHEEMRSFAARLRAAAKARPPSSLGDFLVQLHKGLIASAQLNERRFA